MFDNKLLTIWDLVLLELWEVVVESSNHNNLVMYWIFYWRLSFWVQTLYMDRQGMGFCEEPLFRFREGKMGMRAEGGLTRMGVARQQVQFLQVLVAHNKSLHCSSTLLPLQHCANAG